MILIKDRNSIKLIVQCNNIKYSILFNVKIVNNQKNKLINLLKKIYNYKGREDKNFLIYPIKIIKLIRLKIILIKIKISIMYKYNNNN